MTTPTALGQIDEVGMSVVAKNRRTSGTTTTASSIGKGRRTSGKNRQETKQEEDMLWRRNRRSALSRAAVSDAISWYSSYTNDVDDTSATSPIDDTSATSPIDETRVETSSTKSRQSSSKTRQFSQNWV
eukprot:1553995-Pyramimonas_sp.AAC.2